MLWSSNQPWCVQILVYLMFKLHHNCSVWNIMLCLNFMLQTQHMNTHDSTPRVLLNHWHSYVLRVSLQKINCRLLLWIKNDHVICSHCVTKLFYSILETDSVSNIIFIPFLIKNEKYKAIILLFYYWKCKCTLRYIKKKKKKKKKGLKVIYLYFWNVKCAPKC